MKTFRHVANEDKCSSCLHLGGPDDVLDYVCAVQSSDGHWPCDVGHGWHSGCQQFKCRCTKNNGMVLLDLTAMHEKKKKLGHKLELLEYKRKVHQQGGDSLIPHEERVADLAELVAEITSLFDDVQRLHDDARKELASFSGSINTFHSRFAYEKRTISEGEQNVAV